MESDSEFGSGNNNCDQSEVTSKKGKKQKSKSSKNKTSLPNPESINTPPITKCFGSSKKVSTQVKSPEYTTSGLNPSQLQSTQAPTANMSQPAQHKRNTRHASKHQPEEKLILTQHHHLLQHRLSNLHRHKPRSRFIVRYCLVRKSSDTSQQEILTYQEQMAMWYQC